MKVIKMQTTLIIIGLLVTGGAGFGLGKKLSDNKSADPIIIEDKTSEKQQDVVLQLTDLDLVQEACSSSFIVDKSQGDVLCRELFCRMQQRGVDAKTGASECEAISNVKNKITIHTFCTNSSTKVASEPITVEADGVEASVVTEISVLDQNAFKQCIEFFDRRI